MDSTTALHNLQAAIRAEVLDSVIQRLNWDRGYAIEQATEGSYLDGLTAAIKSIEQYAE